MEAAAKKSEVTHLITDELIEFVRESRDSLEVVNMFRGLDLADRLINRCFVDYEAFIDLNELSEGLGDDSSDWEHAELMHVLDSTELEILISNEVDHLNSTNSVFNPNALAYSFIQRVADVWQELKGKVFMPDEFGPEEKFHVILLSAGSRTIAVIKEIRNLFNLGLKEAKELMEGAPQLLIENTTKDIADEIKTRIEKAGGIVGIHNDNSFFDELLADSEEEAMGISKSALNNKIRRLAKKQGLTASCKTTSDGFTKYRNWWLADESNSLQSPESGLDDMAAMDWLEDN